MFIQKLSFLNYGPFKDIQKVEFNQNSPIVFIQGSYTDNIRKSNRAGKSTLVEGILYLLFGHVRKSLKEVDLIHNGQSEMWVKGTITINGQDIEIKRGRNSKNVATLEITGINCNKNTDRQVELEALIGYNITDFCSVFFFKQNDMNSFMEQGATDKKRLLQGWFKLDKWFTYEKKAKEKYENYKFKTDSNQNMKESLQLKLDKIIIEDDKPFLEELEVRNKSVHESVNRLMNLNTELKNIPNISNLLQDKGLWYKSINTYQGTINHNCLQIETYRNQHNVNENNKQQKQLLQKQLENYNKNELLKDQLELTNQYHIKHTTIQLEQAKLDQTESSLTSTNTFTGMCPIDKLGCDKGARIPEYKQQLEQQVITTKKSLVTILAQKKEIEGKLAKINEDLLAIKKLENQISIYVVNDLNYTDLINDKVLHNKDLEKQIENLNLKIVELDKQLSLHNSNRGKELEVSISQEKQLQVLLKTNIDEINIKLGQIKESIKNKNDLINQISELSKQIGLDKQKELQYKYIQEAFGKDGIPSILIENNLSYLEDNANLILSYVSPTTKIEFSTTKEVSTKEQFCKICGSAFNTNSNKCTCGYGTRSNKVKDEINLKIYEGNRELSFAADSGGGNVLVSLALRLALSKLLSNSKPCNMLVIDELFGQLDLIRREEVTKLLLNTLGNLGNYRNIFVISHTDINDFGNYQTIQIVRDEGKDCSYIKG